MNPLRCVLSSLFPLLVALPCTATVRAQNQTDPEAIERLRRDQEEILRKAESLQRLMQRLVRRYETEKKPDQVKLLQEGLAHLDRSGILREVASIRDDIAATAYAEALRKQREVVDDLERLLNILLERKSVENLDKDLQQVTEQAKSARELEQRQRELQEQTREAMHSPPSPGEQKLLDSLQQLRDEQRREAERNARQAGSRRPFLESALERVRELLRDQAQLEQGLANEASKARSDAKAREFDLGELTERTRELQADLRDQAKTQDLREASRELQKEAAGTDQAAVRQAKDRLEAQLQQAPRGPRTSEGKPKDPAWTELKEQLSTAGNGDSPAEREQLAKVGEQGAKLGEQRDEAAAKANAAAAAKLGSAADSLARRLGENPATPGSKDSAAAALDEAKQHLEAAQKATQAQDTKRAQQQVDEALAALDRARARHRQENPDADQSAREMAAEAAAAAQELQNAPSPEQAEQTASEQLRAAEQALRQVEARSAERADASPADNQARQEATKSSRQQLEQAEKTLQQALDGAAKDNQQDMQDAAARQQQLQEAARQTAEKMQQAAQDGTLQPQQAEKGKQSLQQAQQRMQNAQQKLQSGQQSAASREQQAAAEDLQQAMQQLEQNRPTSPDQKQALEQQAKAQQQLAEDIIRLAKELEKRDNKAAERKVQDAADAAKKAQRAMQQGDAEEAQQEQEKARQNLEDAAKELEEEKDRYQDLRQEELLFRMKDELTTFLTRQRPITVTTLEAQKSVTADGLSRAMRTKVNQLGEEEQELAGKLEFLVQALTEEGNLVYQTVLKANVDDLREVSRRLAGRRPDVGTFATLLQQDVERRTEDLLQALERERQRREQERKDRQQKKDQNQPPGGQNKFDPQRKKLVGLIAELEMLKKLGIDTRAATDNLKALVEARGDDVISEAEVALIERLGHRHAEITRLFQQIKTGVEETLQGMQGHDNEEGGRGR